MEAIAKARFQRISPRKARVVLNMVRGKNAAVALNELRFTSKAAAPWAIDASAVTEVDAAAVQLLVSLSHALAVRSRTLALTNPSRPMVRACDALGVSSLLGAA